MIYRYSQLKYAVKDYNILIVGGGPDAGILTAEQYENYDKIVRLNNYKFANDCHRTDFWFSYFGNNIKNVEQRIKEVDICICKYPINEEFKWVYDLRKHIWDLYSVFIPLERESFQTNNHFNISPTVGLSAIFTFLEQPVKSITIIGFDFFSSGIHNLNEQWDQSGGHKPEMEAKIVNELVANKRIIWLK